MNKSKLWCISFLILALFFLLFLGGLTVVIDPFFHYHAPLDFLEYPINNQRYQNNGILKNFEYDAIITGTSMTENFKASEFDKLFRTNSIKVPLSGSRFKERGDRLKCGFAHNTEIRYVLQSLDYSYLLANKDELSDFAYPHYLYDDILFNDVSYIFNKSILINNTNKVLEHTKNGYKTTNFDRYSNWQHAYTFSAETVLENFEREVKCDIKTDLTQEEKEQIKENLQQNVLSLVVENPQTQFYLFFPPYSILYWDNFNQKGILEKAINVYEYVSQILLDYENIHLFSFNEEYPIICNLDNYKDYAHYSEEVNSQMLIWMKDGHGKLNKENYKDHYATLREFYVNYDYDAIFLE